MKPTVELFFERVHPKRCRARETDQRARVANWEGLDFEHRVADD